MAATSLAPKGQLSMYPRKDTPEKIPLAVRHVRSFLLSHRPTAQVYGTQIFDSFSPASVSISSLSRLTKPAGSSS